MLSDYLNKNFDSIDHDTAIQLGCLEIRRLFKDMLQNALDKKSNIEYLEKEVGLHKFLPKVVLETVKSKSIRKLIQQHFKKFSNFSERDCMFKFMDLLKTVYRYDQERFRFVTIISFILVWILGSNLIWGHWVLWVHTCDDNAKMAASVQVDI